MNIDVQGYSQKEMVVWVPLGSILEDDSCLLFCYDFLQPTISGEIQSPMGVASVEFVDPREPIVVS